MKIMTLLKSIIRNDIDQVNQYIQNGNVIWPTNSYFFCFLHKHYEMAQFLLDNGCPFDKKLFTLCVTLNDIRVLEWLKFNSVKWTKATFKNSTHPQITQWLIENGCPH